MNFCHFPQQQTFSHLLTYLVGSRTLTVDNKCSLQFICDTDARGLSEPSGMWVRVVAIFFFAAAYDCNTRNCWVHSEGYSAM